MTLSLSNPLDLAAGVAVLLLAGQIALTVTVFRLRRRIRTHQHTPEPALTAPDARTMLSVGEGRIPEYVGDDSDLLVDDPDTREITAVAPEPPPIKITTVRTPAPADTDHLAPWVPKTGRPTSASVLIARYKAEHPERF